MTAVYAPINNGGGLDVVVVTDFLTILLVSTQF